MVYLNEAIQEFSLKQSFILSIHGEFQWGLISSKAVGSMSAVLVEKGFFVGVFQVFC